jgi:dipeptidyl aminopeptidase/acylaminoacyl peptidase
MDGMIRYGTALWMVAATALSPLPAIAQTDNATLFGVRESVESIAISPDGSKLAMIQPGVGQSSWLYVADLAGGTPAVKVTGADGDPDRLRWCRWVSNRRLVCSIYVISEIEGTRADFARLVAIDADGKDPKMVSTRTSSRALGYDQSGGSVLDWLPEEEGAILKTRTFVPEMSTGTRLANKDDGVGVERIDTLTLKARNIENPRKDAIEFITDGHGRVRVMGTQPPQGAGGYDGRIINYYYRTPDADGWQPLSTLKTDGSDGFNPYAVDRDLNLAYGLARKDGRQAVFSIALDGSLKQQLVYAHPQVDVDGLVRIGRRNRVVGVTYATEKRQAEYFDPELKKLGAALSKAIPGLPLIRFVDSSLDENVLLLWAGSDVDPGRYYTFDRKARKLNEALLARPQLEGRPISAVKPISYRAADGTMVPGYLTLPAGSEGRKLPAIVMPHGGPGSRDEWGFDWLAQYFVAQGFAVLQPNFRGSAGYGDAWFQKNGFQSWRVAIGDVNDGARWLVAQGIADPAKLAIVGWSYGGYAALQAAATEPDLYKASIAIAPVTDLALMKSNAWKYTSYLTVSDFIGSGPHLQEGSPAQNAAKIKVPVLLFHGDKDLNVDVQQSRLMADRLRDAGKSPTLVVYPKLDHQLDDSQARIDMLRKSDAFLRSAMGLPAK